MRITTPSEVAKQAGNKYLGVLVAAKFARYLNEFPKDQLAAAEEKLTTKAMQSLVEGELNYTWFAVVDPRHDRVDRPARRPRRVGRDRVL